MKTSLPPRDTAALPAAVAPASPLPEFDPDVLNNASSADSAYALNGQVDVTHSNRQDDLVLYIMPGAKLSIKGGPIALTTGRLTLVCLGTFEITSNTTSGVSTSGTLVVSAGSVIDLSKAQQATMSSGAKLSLGKGTMLVLQDTPVLSSEPAAIEGDEAVLQAPPVHVFGANIKVTGSWAIARAYPQWFTSDKLFVNVDVAGKAKSIPDWAPAINKAVLMKNSGEVYLPKGVYTLKSSIRLFYGIRLIGSGATENADKDHTGIHQFDPDAFRVDGTVLMVCAGFSTDLFVKAPISGEWNVLTGQYTYKSLLEPYMIVVNFMNDVMEVTGKNSEAIKQLHLFETPGQPVAIHHIRFYHNRTNESALGSNEINGIFVHGSVDFRHLTFQKLATAVYTDSYYSDRQYFFDCHSMREFTPEEIIDINKAAPSIERFIFFFTGNGDGFVFESCGTETNARVGALYIEKCNGGSITNCILNAQVVMRGCLNMIFSGNHMELGAQLAISCSNVEASGNYFEKGKTPSVKIMGSEYGDKSVVNLSTSQFLFFDGGRTTSETPRSFSPGNFAARVDAMCQYDIEIDDSACLTLCQNYRNVFLYGGKNQNPKSHTYGVLVQMTKLSSKEENGVNIVTNEPVPLDIFNLRSGFLSPWCQLAQGGIVGRVNTAPILTDTNQYVQRLGYISLNDQIPWVGSPAPAVGINYVELFEYKYIFLPEGEKFTGGRDALGLNVLEAKNSSGKILNPIPSTSESNLTGGLLFSAISYVTCQRANLYIQRLRGSVNKSDSTDRRILEAHEVYIPLCFTQQLYDNGITLSSFKWEEILENETSSNNES